MTAGMMMMMVVVVDGNKKGAICYMKKAIYRLSNTTMGARLQRNSRQRRVKKARATAPAGC